MGWLFAVALGLQERKRGVVWWALGPLALGHFLAIGVAILAAQLLGAALPLSALKWMVAGLLAAFGLYHLFRHPHPGPRGMRIGGTDLTIWSFLVASGHGAGLMVLPFVLGPAGGGGMAADAATGAPGPLLAGLPAEPVVGVAATLVHTGAYLLATGVLAVLVYEKLGLRLLRSAWINLDLIWAVALLATAVLTPFL